MADLITNYDIQSTLIAWLKTRTNITNELVDADEIKEDQYGSTVFVYPGVRIRLISNTPNNKQGCVQSFTFGVQVYTQDASSINADRIAGIIAKELHNNQFSASGFLLGTFVTDLVPAYHRDERTWMAEVITKADIQG